MTGWGANTSQTSGLTPLSRDTPEIAFRSIRTAVSNTLVFETGAVSAGHAQICLGLAVPKPVSQSLDHNLSGNGLVRRCLLTGTLRARGGVVSGCDHSDMA